jgi:capsular exopolysaccharide synthesis family protein
MSKLFEALKKAEADGQHPDIVVPLGLDETANAAQAEPQTEPGTLEEAPLPEVQASGNAGEEKAAIAEPAAESDDAAIAAYEQPEDAIAAHEGSVTIRLAAGAPLLPFDGSHPRAGEQYRIIRTKIIQHANEPRMIVVSSAGPNDGKTVNSINIAGVLALKSDARVALVDADFRKSSIASMLGVPQSPGLADVLAGRCTLESTIVRIQQFPNLYVVPAGKPTANPTELLDSPGWSEACQELRQSFKFTIFDAPPIAAVADYDLIQMSCDGVLIIVRVDHTNRTNFFKAVELVPKEKLIGVVVNCVKEWFLWKTQDYSYYHFQTAEKAEVTPA